MGKRTNEPSDKDDTKVIFKKSISSIRTRSRTFSGQSQTFTRSGIIHVKKKISEANTYYFNSGKEKKDLSIETDVCILRRYYKNKLNKLACQDGLSNNRSVKDAEIKTSNIEQKFEAGDSADTLKNVDVVSLIVDNFKDLLNKWIREYILNNENLQKTETVRDSLMHRLELNSLRENTSNSTFVRYSKKNKNQNKRFNKIKKKKKHMTKRNDKRKAVVKCSCYTIPFQCKNVRIISTLSIPRNFDKSSLMNKDSNGQLMYRINKVSRKNIFVSLKKPEDLYVDSSTFNLLAISSKSFTKRCVTYNDKSKKKQIIKRNIAFQSKRRNKKPADSTISMETETNSIPRPDFRTDTGFDPLPSLVKNIYGDISPSTVKSYFFPKNDNFTMTDHVSSRMLYHTGPATSESKECPDFKYCKCKVKNSNFSSGKDCRDPMVTIDFIGSSLKYPPLASSQLKNTLKNISKRSSHKNYRDAKKRNLARLKKYAENNSNLSSVKDFTYLYNKVNKKLTDDSEFLGHFQDIFKYIAGCDGQNVMLDIHVNVYPFDGYKAKPENEDNKIHDNQASYSVTYNSNRRNLDTLIECQETEPCPTNESNGSKSIDSPEIITLLDGAASQAKYIVISENEGAVEDTKSQICSNVSNSTEASKHIKVSETTQVSGHTVSDNTQVSGHTISSYNTKVECHTATKVEITNEINELKNVIQSLAVTTEKLMKEHIKGNKKKIQQKSQGETTVLYNYTVAGTSTEKSETLTALKEIQTNQTKGVHVTQNMLRTEDFPDSKVKMDPKPEVGEFYTRLMEKSTTYHIIDSESVLKITDMTSQANNFHGTGPNDVGITCSIPDSETYFETPVEREKNVLTFFCDGCSGKYRPLSDRPGRRSNVSELGECLSCRGCGIQLSTHTPDKNDSSCGACYTDLGVQCYQVLPKSDDDTGMEDDCCKVLPRRRSFGCFEGLAYCVMLLVVPFAFLSILFYFLVVQKGYLNRNLILKDSKHLSGYKPSDLGF